MVRKIFKPIEDGVSIDRMVFDQPLLLGSVVSRPNRFIANVLIDGVEHKAHCPTTGSIGGWILDGLPALLSGPYTGARSTQYTLEAVQVTMLDGSKQWIGVNQNDANRYVEEAFERGLLDQIAPGSGVQEVKRERKIGDARIDFNANGVYVEVKTPLKVIEIHTQTAMKPVPKNGAAPAMTERIVKHINALSGAMRNGIQAALLTCFIYDAPRFNPPKSEAYTEIENALISARSLGLKSWQVNFSIDQNGVTFEKLQPLSL